MFYVINLFEFLLEMFSFGSNDPKKVVFGKFLCSSSVQITEPILTEFALKPLFWTNKYSREIILKYSENHPLFQLNICNKSVLVYFKKLCSSEFNQMCVRNKS